MGVLSRQIFNVLVVQQNFVFYIRENKPKEFLHRSLSEKRNSRITVASTMGATVIV